MSEEMTYQEYIKGAVIDALDKLDDNGLKLLYSVCMNLVVMSDKEDDE